MAYSEYLADRIRNVLNRRHVSFNEKKMMGGLAFMVDEKMCVGIVKEDLMARIGPELEEENRSRLGVRPMDFTGRPMKGYVFVSPEGIDGEDELDLWIDLCLQFNPLAKSSNKNK